MLIYLQENIKINNHYIFYPFLSFLRYFLYLVKKQSIKAKKENIIAIKNKIRKIWRRQTRGGSGPNCEVWIQ